MAKFIKDERLTKLLKLKNTALPTEEEWRKFDRSFENKVLSSIRPSWSERLLAAAARSFCLPRIALASGLCALLVMLLSKKVATDDFGGSAQQISSEYVQFVNDRMLVDGLGSWDASGACNIKYVHDGVDYVQDSLVLGKEQRMLAKM